MGQHGQRIVAGIDDESGDLVAGSELLLGVRRATAELVGVRGSDELWTTAAHALGSNTLFERVFVSSIQDGVLATRSIYFEDDPSGAAATTEIWLAEPPPLTHLIVESEVVRRRRAITVLDTRRRTIGGALGRAIASDSYVAAPISADGVCCGMVHADRKSSGKTVGEPEREGLWMFTQALSLALRAAELAAHLHRQRTQVRTHLAAVEAALRAEPGAGPRLDPELASPSEGQLAAAGALLAPDHRLHRLLTARELEVLQLMAEGQTNAEIASSLVIAEGTVKSHVKHVLRKMRVGNRTEAVTRYIRLMS